MKRIMYGPDAVFIGGMLKKMRIDAKILCDILTKGCLNAIL